MGRAFLEGRARPREHLVFTIGAVTEHVLEAIAEGGQAGWLFLVGCGASGPPPGFAAYLAAIAPLQFGFQGLVAIPRRG